jgi:hypothetical protein
VIGRRHFRRRATEDLLSGAPGLDSGREASPEVLPARSFGRRPGSCPAEVSGWRLPQEVNDGTFRSATQPLGSISTPLPAATPLCVVIRASDGQRPCGSMPVPSPAVTPLWTVIIRLPSSRTGRADRSRCRRRRGWRSASSSAASAVGVHGAAAFAAGAHACGGVHPPLLPLGSMLQPASVPARTRAMVLIRRSFRWGRCRSRRRCRYGRASRCSSSASAVGVHGAAAFAAGADASRRVHRGPPPLGSTKGPSPARSWVWVVMAISRCRGWWIRDGPRVIRGPVRASSWLVDQPLPSGSMPGPSPARMRVLVVIVSSSCG